jgi:hypothetical protein
MIRAYLDDPQHNWDMHLSCLTAAYRATPHEATGLTPNMMMLGREVQFPGDLYISGCQDQVSPGGYCAALRSSLLQAHSLARERLKKAARKQASVSDVKVSFYSYKAGDRVWYLNEERKPGISPKLQPLYKGPVLILQKVSELDYKVQINQRGDTKLVHHNKLKPYQGKQTLPWANRALHTRH